MARAYGNNQSEVAILKSVGAKPHKNSGRGYVKGDGSDNKFVIDVKEAEKSFTLSKSVWDKICTDAYKVDPNKDPQLLVVLGGRHKLAIIDSFVLQDLQKENEIMCDTYSDLVDENKWLRQELHMMRRENAMLQASLSEAENDDA